MSRDDCLAVAEILGSGKSDGVSQEELAAVKKSFQEQFKKQFMEQFVEGIEQWLKETRESKADAKANNRWNEWVSKIEARWDFHPILATSSDYEEIHRTLKLIEPNLRDHGFDPFIHESIEGKKAVYKLMLSHCGQPTVEAIISAMSLVLADLKVLRQLGGKFKKTECDNQPTIIGPVTEYVSRAPGCEGCELFGGSCVGRMGDSGYGLQCTKQKRSDRSCRYDDGRGFRQCGYYDNGYRCDGWQYCVENVPGSGQGTYGACEAIPPTALLGFDALLGSDAMTCQGAVTTSRSYCYSTSVPLSIEYTKWNTCYE